MTSRVMTSNGTVVDYFQLFPVIFGWSSGQDRIRAAPFDGRRSKNQRPLLKTRRTQLRQTRVQLSQVPHPA